MTVNRAILLQVKRAAAVTSLVLLCVWASPAWASDSLESILAKTKQDGLPVTPLESKIKEGRAKRVPEARIRSVVGRLAGHMREARTWLKSGKRQVPPRLLVSVAQARLSGLPTDGLRRLVKPGSDARASVRVDALVDLHSRGYRSTQAVDLVRKAPKAELTTLGAALDSARVRSGLSHAEVTSSLLKNMGSGSVQQAAKRMSRPGLGQKKHHRTKQGPPRRPPPRGR